jgi:Mg/Co/Ni transporter MgtE
VVDGQGRYQGVLSLMTAYLRKNRPRTVGEIAIPLTPLNGRTDAAAALTARSWLQYTELPVVDERHRILGVVSRASLLRVVGEGTPREFTLERLFSELAGAYFNTCGMLLESVMGKPR